MPGCPGQPPMTRSPPRRHRYGSRLPHPWHTWALMSTAGPAPWRLDEDTGEYLLLADRWHTFFYDLSGRQGMLGQAEGPDR
jgi:hypothetical protein